MASQIRMEYMKSSILYDRILRARIIPLNDSSSSFSVDINTPSKSLKGVLLIFTEEVPLNLIKILKNSLTLSHLGGGADSAPPWETFLNNSKTAKDIKTKFSKFNSTLMGVILHIMTILINLRCCHGNFLL